MQSEHNSKKRNKHTQSTRQGSSTVTRIIVAITIKMIVSITPNATETKAQNLLLWNLEVHYYFHFAIEINPEAIKIIPKLRTMFL